MREILFKGKRADTKEWMYGWLADGNYICDWKRKEQKGYEVLWATVGQYTGLCDENGNKIFEGDILEVESMEIDTLGQKLRCKVIFSESHAAFMVDKGSEESILFPLWRTLTENNAVVIGNIHDNPELLEP